MQEDEKCRLCLQEKPLADSHIIPELLYNPLYDNIHRVLSAGGQSRSHKLIQKGIRERLLCEGKDSCEELFSKWERYASQVMYYIPIEGSDYDDASVVKGIKYATLTPQRTRSLGAL